MDDFTARKNELKAMYKNKQYLDAAVRCSEYIAEADIENFDEYPKINDYYKIMYDCKFKLSDKEDCEKILGLWIRYACDDENIYRIHWNRIRLFIFTGIGSYDKIAALLEQCIGRYKSISNIKAVADLLVLKAMFYKDAKYCKAAIDLYEKCEEDTKEAIEFAKSLMKTFRHLS